MSDHQINYNCFNEPFAVPPYKSLHWDMHGLIFETSIWLLAGSTRLLPNQRNPQEAWELAGWKQRIHKWIQPITKMAMTKLTNVTEMQIQCKSLNSNNYAPRLAPTKEELRESHRDRISNHNSKPWLLPQSCTHWVPYNQESRFLINPIRIWGLGRCK